MILQGLKKISNSAKAMFGLIILFCATTAILKSKLDGVSYAAIIGTIGSIYMWTTHKLDIASLGIKKDDQ